MADIDRKVIVSACLAGVPCNYKGEAKPNSKVVKLVATGKAIPVCPECMGGLNIPRIPAERCGEKVVTRDGTDVTKEYNIGAQAVLKVAKVNGCKLAILKARSPSCGKCKIYDGTFSGKIIERNGVTADLLTKNGIEVKTEDEI
ncbi:MAG: DUF523 domain-containing protein [Patescibacteria group bacterium]